MKARTLYCTPVALATALALAAAYPALAQTGKDSTAAATTAQPATGGNAQPPTAKATAHPQLSAQDKQELKLSQEGFNTMRAVRAARIAIFDGNPKAAHDMIAKAESSLHAASKDATAMQQSDQAKQSSSNSASASTTNTNAKNAGDTEYVPIDGQITLVDAFVDSPAKKSHIDQANQHIAKGNSKAAMDELKLADVGASFTRVLMPLQPTQQHLDAAKQMLDQKKFYEANLALKAVEDGVLIDSVVLTEAPKPAPATGEPAAKPAAKSAG